MKTIKNPENVNCKYYTSKLVIISKQFKVDYKLFINTKNKYVRTKCTHKNTIVYDQRQSDWNEIAHTSQTEKCKYVSEKNRKLGTRLT